MSDETVGRTQDLLFRYGFILYRREQPPANPGWSKICSRWKSFAFDDLNLCVHPECEIRFDRQDGDFTIVLGTAFFVEPPYDRSVLHEFVGRGQPELFAVGDRLSGRFAVIARRAGATVVFHDAYGTRSIAYRRTAPAALASHPDLLATAYGTPTSPQAAEFLAANFKRRGVALLPGDLTMFEGISLLIPNNAYEFEAGITRRYWPRRSIAANDSITFHERCDDHFGGLAAFLRGRRPWLSLTGGIDSRLIIAACNCHDVDYRLFTWTFVSFEEWEREPIDQLKALIGKEHVRLEREHAEPDEHAAIGVRNSGRLGGPSGAAAAMARLAFGEADPIYVTGIGGEVIRGFFNVKPTPLRSNSAEEMARAYVGRTWRDLERAAKADLIEAFDGFRLRANVEAADGFGFDPNDLFYWEHRVACWSAPGRNSMDCALPSLLGFNNRRLAETAYGLPPETRLTKSLFLEEIRRYDRRLAEVGFR